ncbi:MAG: hypothetical protein OHK0029_04900 [Armatimonadaceae bacterium]
MKRIFIPAVLISLFALAGCENNNADAPRTGEAPGAKSTSAAAPAAPAPAAQNTAPNMPRDPNSALGDPNVPSYAKEQIRNTMGMPAGGSR